MEFESESSLMRIARTFGMEKLAWSLRRFYCPVNDEALVLEVGSGGNPYGRSNVLIDAFEMTRERHWEPLVADRPTVLGVVENLPFKDKSFDFVIASHVFEHSTDPEKFLNELTRVAKAGYIEVPEAFMERVNPYKDHRLEITVRNNKLIVRKKKDWRHDPELVEIYEHKAKKWTTQEMIPGHPFDFHVRYYWSDKIDYQVLNPEVNAAWNAPVETNVIQASSVSKIRRKIQKILRNFLSQTSRNNKLDIFPLLRCPTCHSDKLVKGTSVKCSSCGCVYEMNHGVPNLFAIK